MIALLCVEIHFGDIFHVNAAAQLIEKRRIGRIDNLIQGNVVLFHKQVIIAGKVNKAVVKTTDRLIDLWKTGRKEQKSPFSGLDDLVVQMNLHGSPEQEQQIVTAAGRPVDDIVIRVCPVIVAVGDMKHRIGVPSIYFEELCRKGNDSCFV